MIDIHSHILFNADDGPLDIETSVEMCGLAAQDGIKAIIATPHFIVGEENEAHVEQKVSQLNEILKERQVDLEIFSGNEIFIDYHLENLLQSGECLSLNHSRYVLLEFPMMEIPKYSSEVFYELRIKGYVPIIAHPERNRVLQNNSERIYEFVSNECLIQINSSSLTGLHGEVVYNTAIKLLKHNLVHFVGSDAHSTGRRRPSLSSSFEIVSDLVGREKANDLFINNPAKIIKNEDIIITDPIPIKEKSKFLRMFQRK